MKTSHGFQKTSFAPPTSLKRKLPHDDTQQSRDRNHGILSPEPSAQYSRSPSVMSTSSSTVPAILDSSTVSVYNGVLEKKEGWIVAKKASTKRPPSLRVC